MNYIPELHSCNEEVIYEKIQDKNNNDDSVKSIDNTECLDKAKTIINGQRQKDYGKPEDNFNDIAKVWSMYLDKSLTTADVANMMILLKVCRAKNGEYKEDTFIDIAGYATLANYFHSHNLLHGNIFKGFTQ